MYFSRFTIVKLTIMSDRIFLYIEIEIFTSTGVIGAYFIQNYNSNLNFDVIDVLTDDRIGTASYIM